MKNDADKIRDVLSEIKFCEIKLQQLQVEIEMLTGVKGEMTPMSALGLSVRSHNALARAGYRGVEQLFLISDWRTLLLACSNFGEVSLNEVKQKLAEWVQGAETTP